jgi:hypothetical protein
VKNTVRSDQDEHFVEVLKRHKLLQQLSNELHICSFNLLQLLLHGFIIRSDVLCC